MDDYDFVIAVYTAIYQRYEKVGFENLTEPEKVILCVWPFHCEVNNGGFRQYFFNPDGQFASEAAAGLDRVGAHRAAALLRRANAVFPDGKPSKAWDARVEALQALPTEIQRDLFHQLTDEFVDSPEDLYALERAYIVAHLASFASEVRQVVPWARAIGN